MGIEVVVEDERGVKVASLEDHTNILHRALPSHNDQGFHLLNRIDWYGDTTFNRYQIPLVRQELKRLTNGMNESNQDKEFIERLDALAASAESDVHLYLKFYGD